MSIRFSADEVFEMAEKKGPLSDPAYRKALAACGRLIVVAGHRAAELAALPEGANMGLSCGNPNALAALQRGEVVLDLGAGGGPATSFCGRPEPINCWRSSRAWLNIAILPGYLWSSES